MTGHALALVLLSLLAGSAWSEETGEGKPNRLIGESSPYLRQHAVDLDREAIAWACVGYESDDHESPAEDVISWWRDEPFVEYVWRFMKLSGCQAGVAFGKLSVDNGNRKDLAIRL